MCSDEARSRSPNQADNILEDLDSIVYNPDVRGIVAGRSISPRDYRNDSYRGGLGEKPHGSRSGNHNHSDLPAGSPHNALSCSLAQPYTSYLDPVKIAENYL